MIRVVLSATLSYVVILGATPSVVRGNICWVGRVADPADPGFAWGEILVANFS